jgi:hypothetical protein
LQLALLGIRGDLVVSRVSKLELTANIFSEIACFEALTASPFGKVYKNVYISAKLWNLKRKTYTCQVKTEEHAGGMPRHARHE